LWLDLLGLLPEPEVVDAFCSDTSPNYYEQEVDRLLASPHFGERWGRHWLDQARYADSDGFEVDGPRPHAWRWRDWVVDAFNADLPFDQFTIEQIAGDLLPQSTPLQTLATGFLRQSLTNREGGIDQGEARYRELVDRVNSIGTVWLGLTVGCAQCHNHPYDPLTQRDYFGLYAFLQKTEDVDLKLPAERKLKIPGSKGESDEIAAAVVSSGKEPKPALIYRRGDYLQPGDTVEPGFPEFLGSSRPADEEADRPDRLDLARWLVDPENPLTARVAANQLWIRLFGDGLVRTPDDFAERRARRRRIPSCSIGWRRSTAIAVGAPNRWSG
jgi:hypothetical protein